MNKIKCLLGMHNYKVIKTQTVPNMVSTFSMTTLIRDVNFCENCHKVSYKGYDISTNSHLDNTLNWVPTLNTSIKF